MLPKAHEVVIDMWKKLMVGQTHSITPCIKDLLEGVREGERHDTLFTLAVYFKNNKLKRDAIFKRLAKWNLGNSPKLTNSEIGKVINSIMNKEYSVGCGTPLLQAHCDEKECPIVRE